MSTDLVIVVELQVGSTKDGTLGHYGQCGIAQGSVSWAFANAIHDSPLDSSENGVRMLV